MQLIDDFVIAHHNPAAALVDYPRGSTGQTGIHQRKLATETAEALVKVINTLAPVERPESLMLCDDMQTWVVNDQATSSERVASAINQSETLEARQAIGPLIETWENFGQEKETNRQAASFVRARESSRSHLSGLELQLARPSPDNMNHDDADFGDNNKNVQIMLIPIT